MSEILKALLIGAGILLIQIGTGPLLQLYDVRPDFTLIYTLLITLRHGRKIGLMIGFILGLILDFLSLGPIGINALVNSTLAFWIGIWLDNRVGSVAVGWWIFLLAIASLGQGIAIGILSPQGEYPDFLVYVLRYVIPGTLYTLTAGLLWAIAPMGTRSRGPLAPAITRGRRIYK